MSSIIQNVFSFFASNIFASGIFIGVLSSGVYAFMLARIRPGVKFARYISKRRARKNETLSGVKYLFQFWNAGWRDIIDVEVSARLVIRGLDSKYPYNFTFYSIPLGYNTLPRVKKIPMKEKVLELPVMMRLMKRSKQQRKLRDEPLRHQTRLDVHAIQELQAPHYQDFLYRKLRQNQSIREELDRYEINASNLVKDPSLLEHLLRLDNLDVSYIEIAISGYDSLSGTKRLFTKQYKCRDIQTKDFFGKDLFISGRLAKSLVGD